MKLEKLAGATSEIWQVFIRDSSSTTGAGLTALTNASGSLTAYYHRDTDTTATVINLVTMTVGTFTSSGFKEIDSANMPGWYQFCPPNAAIASGAKSCAFLLKGASNMAPLPIEVQLVAVNPDSANAFITGVNSLAPLTAAQIATGVWTDTTAGDFTTSLSVGKSVMNGVSLGAGLTVASVSGTVGSVTGAVGSVTGNVGGSVASVTARVTANADQLAGQTVTAAAGVTFPTSVASPTNITAGTITTVTNLTNAPTVGDLTDTMKTSVTTAATAATPTAAAVTGNVGGNVTGSVGSIASGGIAAASFASGAIDAAAIATDALGALELAAGAATEISTAVWAAATRELTAGTNIVLAKGNGVTGFNDLSAAQVNAEADTALADVGLTTTVTGRVDAAITTRMASYTQPAGFLAATFPSDPADESLVIAATDALAAAIAAIAVPTANQTADAWLDRADAIEIGLTPRQAMRLAAAIAAGKLSGGATATNTIRNAVADSKNRIVATVDADGNRSAVTVDLT